MTTEQSNPLNELGNRPQLLLISLICFAALGYAYYLQVSQDLDACLMCIMARYIILSIGLISIISFVLTYIKCKFAHWCAKGLHVLTYPIVGLGFYYVYQHYEIIKAQSNSCIINPLQKTLNNLPTVDFFPDFFEVRGSCASVQTMFHGIPIHLTPLIVYFLVLFFGYLYFRYDSHMIVKKFDGESS